ncbi:phosphatidylinositol-specific phospholipase C/glycerophosphodiester phosphodiesterase family protein [Kocuria flava]|uniref:phosphatidylinositol-specific phospholipase C/glycerophosphodiester phosphodiesterase family protein n=1 Tax=Kocuria flava TaxID=446860 RepID=UPI001FF5CA0A|nr:phosphatidylinositol-specific phospholipase C/glycerophosphodiester phosphodiesterase family protein [Kocuria flava]MCJ8504268.1 phosphatidylinositol-specific phospholipase C/glycerophosphodiester phosphodiesterase family protein [Kocuria flava]
MLPYLRTLVAAGAAALLLSAPQTAAAAGAELGQPLPRAHAHNDYEHDRPLLDALEHGFTSVEADVWLVDGELRVAHDSWELDGAPTLEEAYLDPLAELVSPNGKQLYPGHDGGLQLLIDLKSEGPATWAAVERELAERRKFITRHRDGRVTERAVEVVISGNRPLADMQAAELRYSSYDGRSTDLDSGLDPSFMPLVSENWTRLFTWQGVGEMPEVERERLHAYVERAHAQGYRVRFWATNDIAGPARENLWTELRASGVDHINTDDLAGLQEFLAGSAG